ncbi:MAG: imidazole glycerol phosphate synthase subunit HisH [Acidobacteriota bacterium]
MIAVIDYRAGNLYNVGLALKHLGANYTFSSDPEEISLADKVILPGVGSARAAMDSLEEKGLCQVLRDLQVPFLGICLGLQLLFETSEEDDVDCLGVIPGTVRLFNSRDVKVPHMGWNQVNWDPGICSGLMDSLLKDIPSSGFYYFVHSYFAPVSSDVTLAATEYDGVFSSAVRKGNYYGFQFHPERSGETGLKLLNNFVNL